MPSGIMNIRKRRSGLLREIFGCLEANGAIRHRFLARRRQALAYLVPSFWPDIDDDCALSPGDHRSRLNALAQIRRILMARVPDAT
jgi:hypothetical protein